MSQHSRPRAWADEHGPDELYDKFVVFKTKDTTTSDELPGPDGWLCGPGDKRLGSDGEFLFVLRPEFDWEAFIAPRCYAQLVAQRSPELAKQLNDKLDVIPDQQVQARIDVTAQVTREEFTP